MPLLALDAGQNYDGSQRFMVDALGNFLPYEISSPLFGPWGGGVFTYPAPLQQDWTSTGQTVFVIESEITPQPLTIPAGYYSDVVKVTVFY